jgi:hypothetical protein
MRLKVTISITPHAKNNHSSAMVCKSDCSFRYDRLVSPGAELEPTLVLNSKRL